MARQVKKQQGGLTNTTLLEWVRQWLILKTQREQIETRENEIKKRLHGVVEERGYTDDKGHQWFELPEAIDGIAKLKRERRVVTKFDVELVEAMVLRKRGRKDKGPLDDVIVWVPAVDEDAIMAAYYRKDITEEELDSLMSRTVNYAFKAVR